MRIGRLSGILPWRHSAVAVAWFELLYERVKAERLSPPVAARTYGIASVALYEAVIPGMPENRSLGGQLNDLPRMPRQRHARRHDWPLVANSALATTLRELFAGGSAETRAAIEPRRFNSFFEAAGEVAVSRLYGGIHFRAAVEHGVDQGLCIGRQILQRVEFRKRSGRDDAADDASDNAATRIH